MALTKSELIDGHRKLMVLFEAPSNGNIQNYVVELKRLYVVPANTHHINKR